MTKWTAALTALALVAATAAPAPAFAYDHRGGGYRHHNYGHYHGRDDAVAAGVVGLVLGLALGAALSDPGPPRARCTDNYRRCAPPPSYGPRYPDRDYDPDYDKEGASYQGAEPDDRRAAYDRDYGQADQSAPSSERERPGASCVHPARTWDPYAGAYVWVNVRTC